MTRRIVARLLHLTRTGSDLCSALGLAARPEWYSGQHVSRGRYGSPEYEERTL